MLWLCLSQKLIRFDAMSGITLSLQQKTVHFVVPYFYVGVITSNRVGVVTIPLLCP